MSTFQTKVIHHIQNQDLSLNIEWHSIESKVKKHQNQDGRGIRIVSQRFKAVIIKGLQQAITNMYETNEKIENLS